MKPYLFLCVALLSLLAGSFQSRAAAPIAVTVGTSDVSSNATTLHGMVTPRAANTRAYFQWGLTTNYGNVTATQILSGSVAVPVQQSIAGLAPLTTYHFRTVARNAYGVRYGTNVSFVTAGFPPMATTATPTDITTNSTTLRGTANPNGLATTAYFEWGTTTNYGTRTASQALGAGSAGVSVQASLSGLTSDTPYHYRLVASNALGVTYGNDVIVTPTLMLYLYAGESWTYEFHDLPFIAAFPGQLSSSVSSTFDILPGSFPSGASVQFDLFEDSTNGPGVATVVVNNPAGQGFAFSGTSSWEDYQGTLRLTVLTGSVVVTSISLHKTRGGNPFADNETYRNVILPTKLPQPAALGTQFVSSVSFASGVISADINAKNLPTAVFVEWGTTTNYGSITGVLPLNFDYFVRREVTVSNLASATLYHLRIVATNNAGVTYGRDLTFTTPTAVITLPPTERQSTAVKLNGTATVNGFATFGYFEWGQTTNYGQVTPVQDLGSAVTVTNVSAPITGLTPQTTYHCRAVVYSGGATNRGADVAFTTTPVPTNFVVTNLATDDVRGAIQRGGVVVFNCDGVLVLSNQIEIANNVVLDASGHSITFSGSNVTRIFKVLPGTSLILTNITLANGRSTNGGAIYNEGTLIGLDCRFQSNAALGIVGTNGTNGFAGNSSAAYNPGAVTAGEPGGAGGAGTDAFGGAILNYGSVALSRCLFVESIAEGGRGGNGGDGGRPGMTPLPFPTYSAVSGDGGRGGGGGMAYGGAIASLGILELDGCTFSNSLVQSGVGGKGGTANSFGPPGVTGFGGPGGSGGSGLGGAVFTIGTAVISNCAFIGNEILGGAGGNGGPAYFSLGGHDGAGASGGFAEGAGVYNGSNCVLANCTFAENAAIGGSGGNGPGIETVGKGGDALGGGLMNARTLQVVNLTMSGNRAYGGLGGSNNLATPVRTNGNSFGGTIANESSLQIANSILDRGSSNNFYGSVIDLGHNISSDATPAWTSSTSRNSTDPLLLPLANNGGPTLTMALGAGSPALDSADCATAPPTDQRGFPRPSGPGCDIGASEGSVPLAPYIYIFRESSATNVLRWLAEAGRSYRIEGSADLSAWTAMATNIANTNGWLDYRVPANPSPRFFRLHVQ